MHRIAFLSCLVLALGCSNTHVSGDGGSSAPDAGRSGDGGLADAAAAPDAGGTDGGVPGFTICTLETGEHVGEPCFCPGPAVLFGNVVYRQSIGIEVWDVSEPSTPTQVRTVPERAASDGGLAIALGHLISIRNLDAALTVYRLDDPTSPLVRSTLDLPGQSPSRLVVAGELAVFVGGSSGAANQLFGVGLSDLDAPEIRWTVSIEGRVVNVAADLDRVYVLTQSVVGEDAWLEVRSASTGASEGRYRLAEGPGASSYYAGLALHRGRVLLGAPGALRVLEIGETLVEYGRLELEEAFIPTLTVERDLLLLGGSTLHAVDLSDPALPRDIGRADVPIGDLAFLMIDEDRVFVSSGGGLRSVRLTCE